MNLIKSHESYQKPCEKSDRQTIVKKVKEFDSDRDGRQYKEREVQDVGDEDTMYTNRITRCKSVETLMDEDENGRVIRDRNFANYL